jgi:hypothetical protein
VSVIADMFDVVTGAVDIRPAGVPWLSSSLRPRHQPSVGTLPTKEFVPAGSDFFSECNIHAAVYTTTVASMYIVSGVILWKSMN